MKAATDLTDATLGMPEINDTLLARYISIIQFPVIVSPQQTAYQSMRNSGQLNLISNLELRNKVTALHEFFYIEAGVYDQYLSEHIRDYVKPYFMDNITYTSSSTINNNFIQDVYFQKIIFRYKFIFEARNDFYKSMKSETDELIAYLMAN